MALRTVATLSGDDVTTHNYSIVFPIDDVNYDFTFSYNARQDRWVLNITDPFGDPVLVGAVIVQSVDLFTYANPAIRPRGVLTCTWKSNAPSAPEPGEFDLGKSSQIIYYERPEDLFITEPTDPPLA